jgi:thiol-disulfide isomerase/thioredoxin
MKRNSKLSYAARRALEVACVFGIAAFSLSSGVIGRERFHIMTTAKAAGGAARAVRSSLGDEGAMPELDGATGWLNSMPLNRKALQGKVVLVNFWTFTCINSIRPFPYLRSWIEKYKDAGFVLIGVHTPEFSFEHEPVNVETAARNLNIVFPIAVDSKYGVWKAFNNQAWPAQYLIDAKGRIRYQHFGESDYDEIESAIRELLKESGATNFATGATPVSGVGIEAAPDWPDERSPETYIGYRQAQNFASPEKLRRDSVQLYSAPLAEPMGPERIVERERGGRCASIGAGKNRVSLSQPRSECCSGPREGRQAGSF